MAGYTRQSASAIIPSNNILSSHFNAEFNALQAAFNATTGHAHNGTLGNGPKIALTTSISGVLPVIHGGFAAIHKIDATTAPTVTDDSNSNYGPGSVWVDVTNDRHYTCVDASVGAAVWKEGIRRDGVNINDLQATFTALTVTGAVNFDTTLNVDGDVTFGQNLAVTGTLGVTGDATFANMESTSVGTFQDIVVNGTITYAPGLITGSLPNVTDKSRYLLSPTSSMTLEWVTGQLRYDGVLAGPTTADINAFYESGSSAGAYTLTLPSGASLAAGAIVMVSDSNDGNCGTNNTIISDGTDTWTIDENYGWMALIYSGSAWRILAHG